MAYSSSLIDKEWERLEPLLSEVLPPKKQTRPPAWTKRELLDGVLYQLKMAVTGKTYPKTYRPIQPSIGTTNNGMQPHHCDTTYPIFSATNMDWNCLFWVGFFADRSSIASSNL